MVWEGGGWSGGGGWSAVEEVNDSGADLYIFCLQMHFFKLTFC